MLNEIDLLINNSIKIESTIENYFVIITISLEKENKRFAIITKKLLDINNTLHQIQNSTKYFDFSQFNTIKDIRQEFILYLLCCPVNSIEAPIYSSIYDFFSFLVKCNLFLDRGISPISDNNLKFSNNLDSILNINQIKLNEEKY